MNLRLPPLNEDGAKRGEVGSAEYHLRDIATRLRRDSTQEERDEAARILDRAADWGGRVAWGLCLNRGKDKLGRLTFGSPRRPISVELEIYRTVEDLLDAGVAPSEAYDRVAPKYPLQRRRRSGPDTNLAAGTIKKIHLYWKKVRLEEERWWAEELKSQEQQERK